MCGILGLINTTYASSAAAALRTLAARGPDRSQLVQLDGGVLGHTRLAVIDVAGGEQPMRSPDQRYTLVFNGEIYNFRTLRRELEAAGYRFATESDTEVLMHGFREWGERIVPRLDGMFAFAVWDARERVLFAARDRMGIKPFFYSTVQGLCFASTLAPFFALPGFPRQISYPALRDYLAFQTPLAPQTIMQSVQQLPPATQLRWEATSNKLSLQQYWSISPPSPTHASREEHLDSIDAALQASVTRQMVSDVPLGAFLSGGIDSSLMVHYMAQAGVQPLKTFSMAFAERSYDETSSAVAVAKHFDTEHHVLDAPQIDGDCLAATIGDLDQPLADPAYVMTHALARLTRQQVTVAISGDGGDELFGGYPRFLEQESSYPSFRGQALFRSMVMQGWLPGALLRRSLAGRERLLYRRVELGPWPVSRKSMRKYLSEYAWSQCVPEDTLLLWRSLAQSYGGDMDTASLMRADLWTYLSENCLAKTDRASMAHGLEVRVPMLGNAVLDSVLTLPADVHFNPQAKAILYQLAQRYLPSVVWDRPKHGFSVPLQNLFNGAWRDTCERVIYTADEIAPFLNAAQVAKLWRNACVGKGSRRLAYTFVVLLLWLEQYPLSY